MMHTKEIQISMEGVHQKIINKSKNGAHQRNSSILHGGCAPKINKSRKVHTEEILEHIY